MGLAQVTSEGHRVVPPPVLDMDAAARFKHELVRLLDSRPKLIVVDMSEVAHLDALPIAVIIHAARVARAAGGRLVITGLHGQPYESASEWEGIAPLLAAA